MQARVDDFFARSAQVLEEFCGEAVESPAQIEGGVPAAVAAASPAKIRAAASPEKFTAAVTPEKLVAATSTAKIEEEFDRERVAGEVGKEFVKNGSRDRWGNLRKNIGGRPRTRHLKAGSEGPETPKSNRKRAGCRSRQEFHAQEKLIMIRKLNEIKEATRAKFHRKSEKLIRIMFNRAARKEFPHLKKPKDVDELMDSEKFCEEKVVMNSLGRDLTNPGRRSRGVHFSSSKKTYGNNPGVGFRKAGGGRKNKFEKIWERVKAWHTLERLKGLQVDQQDIWISLEDQLTLEIEVLQFLLNRDALQPEQIVWLDEVRERLEKLKASRQYRDVHIQRLMSWAGMSVGRPQRRSGLSLTQEKLGWQVTMNSWDRAIWLAAHGSEEELKGHVSVPEEFIKQREKVVIVCSDQVPVWIARQLQGVQEDVWRSARQPQSAAPK